MAVGDCVAEMGALPDQCVDVVVTSPPYNIGVKYGRYKDTLTRADYLAWIGGVALHVHRLLKVDGSLFLNLGSCPKEPLLPYLVVGVVSQYFHLQNTIHWVKSVTIEHKRHGTVSAGHFKPINSGRFVNDCHEYLFHFTRTGRTPIDRLAVGVPYADKSNARRWKAAGGKDRRCRGNVLFLPYQTVQRKKRHPAAFPPELAEYCLKLHGLVEEQVVMDPFLGVGNAALAAKRCGVKRFIGWDIDEEYVAESWELVGGE